MNQNWEHIMQKHAKSFHLASLFLPPKIIPQVKALYALCRWLDDAADEAENSTVAIQSLNDIRTDLISNDSKMTVNVLYKESQLSTGYMEDLIDGVKEDLGHVRIQSRDELIKYSYKVAGTVGLAMCDLMNVKDPNARANAVDLGIAMQITNICRDVCEDLNRNRVYLPIEVLNKYNISETEFTDRLYRDEQLECAVKNLLVVADQYYESARAAFPAIPYRSRLAIIVASNLYQSIGKKLMSKQDGNPMRGRVWLNPVEKSIVVVKSLGEWATTFFHKPQVVHNKNLHKPLEHWVALRGF